MIEKPLHLINDVVSNYPVRLAQFLTGDYVWRQSQRMEDGHFRTAT